MNNFIIKVIQKHLNFSCTSHCIWRNCNLISLETTCFTLYPRISRIILPALYVNYNSILLLDFLCLVILSYFLAHTFFTMPYGFLLAHLRVGFDANTVFRVILYFIYYQLFCFLLSVMCFFRLILLSHFVFSCKRGNVETNFVRDADKMK